MNIIPLPKTSLEAIKLLAMCDFEDDNICEIGDNLIVIQNGDEFIFSEEPDDNSDIEEVTYKITKVS